MNVKLHTPKTLKTGSGLSTVKQILLSIVATTISIVLTFGTAAFLDERKKQEEKREMTMVLLYDLASGIEQVEKADSSLRAAFDDQVEVAAKPESLSKDRFFLTHLQGKMSLYFTETIERIFSSNIETIYTLDNVLFAENVSELYQLRRQYKEDVCDKVMEELRSLQGVPDYDQVLSIDLSYYIAVSGTMIGRMKELFDRCKQMMDVSDNDLEAYRQKCLQTKQSSATDSIDAALIDEMMQNYQRMEEAIKTGRKVK